MPKKLLTLLVMICSLVIASAYFSVGADDLSTISVTTSDPRPSFRGGLALGNTAGTSSVIINTLQGDTSGAYPSSSSAQLYIGDQVKIGIGGSLVSYSVTDIVNASIFNISPVIGSGSTAQEIIATRSGTLAVRFKTRNAVLNGRFRVLVPALSSDTASTDGIPDSGYFDSPTGVGVSCPANTPNYTFAGAGTSVSAITVGANEYHAYVCPYTGLGGIGVGSTNGDFTTNYLSISGLVNPAPKKTSHIIGTADTYNVLVQQLDSTNTVVDSSTVQIGVVEAVHVTASVDPQISFRILGIGATGICGTTTTVVTTPTSVPFGSLPIQQFTDAAQALSVTTNAQNGYVVTAMENDQLAKGGVTCTGDGSGVNTCIIDSSAVGISHTASAVWSDTTKYGFGYTLHDANTSGTTPAFTYAGTTYKQFADNQAAEAAQTIMSSTGPAANHNLYVCYRANISQIQVAGDYENYITYTATATF